jgi:glycosyltransferase involved in cell wall biosynthesis
LKPLIVHSPTAVVGKGTKYVIAAVDELKKNHDFEFILIKDMSHETSLGLIKRCDIFIDQLISGGYGMAAMEAMSFGKPVICYMKESVIKEDMPHDVPIVNANPDNIKVVLEELLNNGTLRNRQGKLGRAYIEKYHDIRITIPVLIEVYKNVINYKIKQIRNAK